MERRFGLDSPSLLLAAHLRLTADYPLVYLDSLML